VSFGIPLSLLADRVNRRNIIAVSLIVWSAMTVLCGPRGQLLAAAAAPHRGGDRRGRRHTRSHFYSGDYFPPLRRPMALTIFFARGSHWRMGRRHLAGRIADAYGWRAVFLALGIPGVVFGAFVFFTIREPRRGQLDAGASAAMPSLPETMAYLWRQRSAVHLMLGSAVTALWGWGLVWWITTFLVATTASAPVRRDTSPDRYTSLPVSARPC